MFKSKEESIQGKTQLIASSLSGLEVFTEENVSQVITLLGDMKANRVIVTDEKAKVLYDSLKKDNAKGKFVVFPEIVQAMEGQDVFRCIYQNDVLQSRACIPLMRDRVAIGAVYLTEYDADQGAIISALESNIIRTTFVLSISVTVFSIFFSIKFSRRMRLILQSTQRLGAGEYSHKIAVKGHDEVGILASEFNKLTDRLQASEEAQRQFVSDASHELKTPLASIKLLTDSILQNKMDMSTVQEFVQDIGNESDRLTRMAHKLLELNRLDCVGKDDYIVLEMGPVVEKVMRLLTPVAALRNINLDYRLDSGCSVVTIEDDLHEIVFNLVENGIINRRSTN